MLKNNSLLLVIASFCAKIVHCEDSDLPQVFIPTRSLFLPQNPPKLPRIYLAEEKFTLPQFCRNASEWEDVDLSIKILTETTEEPERSSFASLVNLIKFILIKEELPCLNAVTGPVLEVKRPEGKIFPENRQISKRIEIALANRPKQKATPIDFYDNIDINNMIPIWRPRGNKRRRPQAVAPSNGTNVENACKAGPKVLQNLGSGITIVGDNASPITKGTPVKASSKCPRLTLKVQPKSSNGNLQCHNQPSPNIVPVVLECGNCNICQKLANPHLSGCPKLASTSQSNLQCQNLPSTNIRPVVLGCGGNCNICQKLGNILPGCPKLASAVMTGCGCPKTNVVLGGCQCSKPVVGPQCSPDILPVIPCQTKHAVTVLQSEAVPMMNSFGNLMKKVTTTVLMPY